MSSGLNMQATLVLCVSYGLLYSVQNMMAPNLTMMASEFGFDEHERDLYLGANLNMAFSVVCLPLSSVFAYAADVYNRKWMYSRLVLVGAASALMMAFSANTYMMLFFWRTVSGVAITGAIPVVFSLIADWYGPEQRPKASSGLSAAMGAGVIVGQILAGFVGPIFGWRAPFVLASLPGFVAVYFINKYMHEPTRGAKEEALEDLIKKGGSYDKKPTFGTLIRALRVPTNVLLLLQALPGTIPWGVIFVYLNDFLAQEKGLTIQQATMLVGVFGIGAAVGGIGGGILGARMWKRSKPLMPMLMGGSTALGVLPMVYVIGSDLKTMPVLVTISMTFLAGLLPNINGSCVRPLLLNVNTPESRGTMIGAMTLVANLGRGLGPSIAVMIMDTMGGRAGAMQAAVYAWLICGVFLLTMAVTVTADVKRMTLAMKHNASEMAV